jgi:hypothetical protein
MSEEAQTSHKHLCRLHGGKYECTGTDCADYEYSVCNDCKEKKKKTKSTTIK